MHDHPRSYILYACGWIGGANIAGESGEQGLCEDDEDLYFMRLVLDKDLHGAEIPIEPKVSPPTSTASQQPPHSSDPDSPRPVRTHSSGSARTEGYYKISHAELRDHFTLSTDASLSDPPDGMEDDAESAWKLFESDPACFK